MNDIYRQVCLFVKYFLDRSFRNVQCLHFCALRGTRRQTGLTIGEKKLRSKRDDLIDTALRLFYTQGFNATGIDKILAESGVAKMTMYKHFKSKDELIVAALERRDEQFRDWLTGEMEKASS